MDIFTNLEIILKRYIYTTITGKSLLLCAALNPKKYSAEGEKFGALILLFCFNLMPELGF